MPSQQRPHNSGEGGGGSWSRAKTSRADIPSNGGPSSTPADGDGADDSGAPGCLYAGEATGQPHVLAIGVGFAAALLDALRNEGVVVVTVATGGAGLTALLSAALLPDAVLVADTLPVRFVVVLLCLSAPLCACCCVVVPFRPSFALPPSPSVHSWASLEQHFRGRCNCF